MKIKLICDSLCDVPQEVLKNNNIDVVPLTIIVENKEYKDSIDITNQDFYKMMKEIKVMPKTSQATYMQFKDIFSKYVGEYEIVCITGSSKSSGTYQSAMIAKNDTEGNIHIFDTLNLSLGSGQYVIKAAELKEQGLSGSEIISELENLRSSVTLFFVPDSLEYLKRSGRVSVTSAAIGNMLNLKPLFSVEDGNISLLTKIRGKKHVVHEMLKLLKQKYETLEDKNIIIGCGDNERDLETLKKEVENIKAKKIFIAQGGACICSHTGPDILAISCSN